MLNGLAVQLLIRRFPVRNLLKRLAGLWDPTSFQDSQWLLIKKYKANLLTSSKQGWLPVNAVTQSNIVVFMDFFHKHFPYIILSIDLILSSELYFPRYWRICVLKPSSGTRWCHNFSMIKVHQQKTKNNLVMPHKQCWNFYLYYFK